MVLAVLLGLFCLRVLGQLAVAAFDFRVLPPMEEWYSGAVAYPQLLLSQVTIIVLAATIVLHLHRGRGRFALPNRLLGRVLLFLGALYLVVMVLRYGVRMTLYPPERWTGGSIPIFFHWVLAAFVLVLGRYHARQADPSGRTRFSGRMAFAGAATISAFGVAGWLAYLVAPAMLAQELGAGAPQYAVRVHRGVAMSARDGTELVADLYRPRRADPTPTLLVRIPYSKTLTNTLFATVIGRMWAEHGYTVVIQGTRGRYQSGGRYEPLVHEREDGIDTLNWLARQRWFDGRLGMWGGSYFGYTQWVLADRRDPGPAALFVQIASTSMYDFFYPGGAFALRSALYWALRSHGLEDRPVVEAPIDAMPVVFPLRAIDDRFGQSIEFFDEWAAHRSRDDFWIAIDGRDRAARSEAPVLLLGGWFDPFLPAQIADFETIRARASPRVAAASRLVIGPWGHAHAPTLPDGYEPENYRLASLAPSLAWFDRHLKSISTDTSPAPVRLFVMGANEWRDEWEWPLARTRYTSLYVRPGGEGGSLSTVPPDGTGEVTFEYDPLDPVGSRGGAILGTASGMREQARERRADVLHFETMPLENDIEITGPITAVLHVETSAPRTDFTVALNDVHPDGREFNISDGILRRRYDPAAPGATRVEIELWPTSIVIPRGHALALRVSSSSFPRYDVNPNTPDGLVGEAGPVKATQTLHWGGEVASHVVLPVVPMSESGELGAPTQ